MKTRKLAQAEDDPELNKTVKLASILKEIWKAVTTAKGTIKIVSYSLFS